MNLIEQGPKGQVSYFVNILETSSRQEEDNCYEAQQHVGHDPGRRTGKPSA